MGFLVTIDGKRMLLPAVAGDKMGVFYPDYSQMDPAMETILRERMFDRIQGVYVPGTQTDGLTDCYSFWGYGGHGNATGTFTSTVREVTPTYDIIREVTSTEAVDRAATGFVTFGALGRKNLTVGKRGQAPKPDNIGGAPKTRKVPRGDGIISEHFAYPTSREGAEGYHETPPPGYRGGDEAASETSTGGAAATEAPAAETNARETAPVSEAPTTEAAPAGEAPAAEAPAPSPAAETASKPEAASTTFEAPGLGSENLDLSLTDGDSIRAAAGEHLSDEMVAKIQRAIARWNSLTPEYRQSMLRGDLSTYSYVNFGPDRVKESKTAYADMQALILLSDNNLVRFDHLEEARRDRRYWKEMIKAAENPRVPLKAAVRFDSESLDLPTEPSAPEVRALSEKKGKTTVSYDDMVRLGYLIRKWNAIDPTYRRNMLDGRDKIEKRGFNAHGGDLNEIGENERIRDELASFGLIEPLPVMEVDEAPAAAEAASDATAAAMAAAAEADDAWAA